MATASIPIPNPSEETLALWREERRRLTRDNSRLGFPFALRLPISTITGFCAGGLLGVIHGTKRTSLLFRAENAHRLPTTPTGWYLYHKSKNYQTAAGGLREGVRFGGKIAFWTALFFSTEELLDRARKGWVGKEGGSQNDVFSTVVASLSLAGAFSVWSKCWLSSSWCYLYAFHVQPGWHYRAQRAMYAYTCLSWRDILCLAGQAPAQPPHLLLCNCTNTLLQTASPSVQQLE